MAWFGLVAICFTWLGLFQFVVASLCFVLLGLVLRCFLFVLFVIQADEGIWLCHIALLTFGVPHNLALKGADEDDIEFRDTLVFDVHV